MRSRFAPFVLFLFAAFHTAPSYCVQTAPDTVFASQPIHDTVFLRLKGKSYPDGCTVPRSELRYLRLSYCNAEGLTQTGEMVCNKAIAADLVDIFRQLWLAGYRIERMRLIDDYDADDQRSMEANNTSCFCYRTISGTQTLSKHAQGLAVDINTLYNPYIFTRQGKTRIEPRGGRKWAYNRDKRTDIPYKIDHHDLCYRLFLAHGFRWGGDWRTAKDYQHFER